MVAAESTLSDSKTSTSAITDDILINTVIVEAKVGIKSTMYEKNEIFLIFRNSFHFSCI